MENIDFETKDDVKNNSSIRVKSGAVVDLLNPDPDKILLGDIAYALSNINRFTGHSTYNVAAHSEAVAFGAQGLAGFTPTRREHYWIGLLGLLHDAHEAYVGDVSRPLKYSLATQPYADSLVLRSVARRIQQVIEDKYLPSIDTPWDATTLRDLVKQADNDAFAQEQGMIWPDKYPGRAPIEDWESYTPEYSQKRFIRRYQYLSDRLRAYTP